MTANKRTDHFWMIIVNGLTATRLVLAPTMIALAWGGEKNIFLATLLITFSTDVADGILARLTGQKTAFGAQFDSIADFVTYTAIGISVAILWPELIAAEIVAAVALVASVVVPSLIGVAKFGRFTSYHTFLTKIAVATFMVALFGALWGGLAWPLRFAALIASIAALEEIIITTLLSKPEPNVKGVITILRKCNSRE